MSENNLRRRLPATESALVTLAIIIGVGALLSVITIIPSTGAAQSVAGSPNNGAPTQSQPGSSAAPGPIVPGAAARQPTAVAARPGQPSVPGARPGLACASGQNGGATDTGVTATNIEIAATTVTDGPGASFLAPVNEAMNAVVRQVARQGGICGRVPHLKLANDSWQEQLGEQYIQNFVQGQHVFALTVNPDSEGLHGAAKSGYIARQGVPVVGTGGQVDAEYENPWIWPVGTSTASQMHIMAQDAYNRGARNFAIVFDAKYHFGFEGAYAFNQAVKRLTGTSIPGYDSSLSSCAQGSRFCGIQPGQSNYTSQAHQFDNACYNAGVGSHACDFVAYLLEPDLALSWLSNGSTSTPAYGAGGAQPLFDRQAFASQCDACNISSGFVAWTGYQPPEGSFTGQPAETAYVNLLHSGNSSIDVDNQFVEGGYIGMNLFMNALRAVGPDLTRARLKAVLDSTTDHNGLSRPLVFRPGNHLANAAAMGWRLNYANGQFTGFSPVTKFQTDPWLGQDLNAPTK